MSDYGDVPRVRFGGMLTPTVKALILANVAVFVAQFLVFVSSAGSPPASGPTWFEELFALRPALAIEELRIWQFLTHAFLHDVSNPLHILFNLLMLWMFGGEVEATLGRRRFLRLYLGAALAGGICMIPWYDTTILGASGAVFGVMAMYARLYPYRRLLVWGILPVQARTLMFVLVGVDLLLAIQGSATGTAHLAHVGGFAVGWFFLRLEQAGSGFRVRREAIRAQRRMRKDAETSARIDELLAKVGREGLQSLSEREREFLRRESKRYRR